MKKILMLIASAIVLSSCGKEEFKNINKDPNAVTKPDISYMFLQAQDALPSGEYTIWFYTANRFALPWSQLSVGDRGSLNISTMFEVARWDNPFWGNMYGSVGKPVKEIQHLISTMDDETKKTYQNFYHMAQIMYVQTAIYATDYNGDIPYVDALKGYYSNPPMLTPKYDEQEVVFQKMDEDLVAAIEILGNEELMKKQIVIKSVQEPVYKADYKKWVRFANALRLKIALRLIHANPARAKEIAGEVARSGNYMKTNSDDYRAVFSKTSYGPGTGSWPGTASESFLDLLKANKDPRIRAFYNKNPYNAGVIQGMLDQGLTFPDYLADQMVVVDGKFIRWKSKEMGDGDQYLGEPWVRYTGFPVTHSGDLPQSEIDKYTTGVKFRVKINNVDRDFLPGCATNTSLIAVNDTRQYPSMKPTQDEYRANNAYNYTLVMASAAESQLILAMFALQGVNVPGESANSLYQNAIKCSVQAYDQTMRHHNALYYNAPYDETTFINKNGVEEVIEKPIKLKEGELEEMLSLSGNTLTGNIAEDVEKCYIQLVINSFQYPGDIYTYAKLGGIPKYNSNVWPRVAFVNDEATDRSLNIPRHFKFSDPASNKANMNWQNQEAAFKRQGFLDYQNASPNMAERMWNDKNSPAWGAGPIVR